MAACQAPEVRYPLLRLFALPPLSRPFLFAVSTMFPPLPTPPPVVRTGCMHPQTADPPWSPFINHRTSLMRLMVGLPIITDADRQPKCQPTSGGIDTGRFVKAVNEIGGRFYRFTRRLDIGFRLRIFRYRRHRAGKKRKENKEISDLWRKGKPTTAWKRKNLQH